MGLVEKIVHIHRTLSQAEIPFAFGGALALAWCTQRARGTIDIDVNIFIEPEHTDRLIKLLPKEIKHTKKNILDLKKEGQVRLWWQKTPVDIFLNTTPYHQELKSRIRHEHFSNENMPFLSCQDLAVFKAFFNRTKDWADIEEMQLAQTLDVKKVERILIEYLGHDDERISKLKALSH